MGGDLLPSGMYMRYNTVDFEGDYIADFLGDNLRSLKNDLGEDYPRIFAILGNDDGACFEGDIINLQDEGLWEYIHNRRVKFEGHPVYGYAFVNPTPFLMKDWDKYDVSRYNEPGTISPEDGRRTVEVEAREIRYSTIVNDLEKLAGDSDLGQSIFLFHAPPYKTKLDRAALDGKMVDHVPLDVHVGSIAIQRFIEKRQPLLTMHGHIHESTRLTGEWSDKIGSTIMFNAANDKRELAVIKFDLKNPAGASRELY